MMPFAQNTLYHFITLSRSLSLYHRLVFVVCLLFVCWLFVVCLLFVHIHIHISTHTSIQTAYLPTQSMRHDSRFHTRNKCLLVFVVCCCCCCCRYSAAVAWRVAWRGRSTLHGNFEAWCELTNEPFRL
jgi:hypothetical protein